MQRGHPTLFFFELPPLNKALCQCTYMIYSFIILHTKRILDFLLFKMHEMGILNLMSLIYQLKQKQTHDLVAWIVNSSITYLRLSLFVARSNYITTLGYWWYTNQLELERKISLKVAIIGDTMILLFLTEERRMRVKKRQEKVGLG
jgi:hypothetical protein